MTTTSTPSVRSREAQAFLDARRHIGPDQVSACAGFTAHEVTAHLTAIFTEVTGHLRPYLEGQPIPATRTFEEREPPFRALDDAALLDRFDTEERAFRELVDQVLAGEPDAVIPWTGRRMAVAAFPTHLRNELTLHRWDLVGDDDIGDGLLAQPELTVHSVGVLGEILVRRGREHDPEPDRELHVRLRTPGTPDLALDLDGPSDSEAGRAGLRVCAEDDRPEDAPRLELDAAARVLVIWGRRPARPGRVHSLVDQPTLARVHALLSGY